MYNFTCRTCTFSRQITPAPKFNFIGPRQGMPHFIAQAPFTELHKIKMAPRVGILLYFIVAFISSRIFANKVDEEETCRRYAGGQVYPERTTISEHAVHWSKAQSKFDPFKST